MVSYDFILSSKFVANILLTTLEKRSFYNGLFD